MIVENCYIQLQERRYNDLNETVMKENMDHQICAKQTQNKKNSLANVNMEK